MAVVGMAAKLPGAADIDRFWDDLRAGREAVRFPSDEELLAAGVPERVLRDPSYVKAVAEPPDLEVFDADFFGFTPREADLLDPQIRMFLEVAHRAVEHAGYDPHAVAEGMGVFGATGVNRYVDLHVRAATELSPSSTAGLALSVLSYPDYLSTQLAYRFGFRGPALTVSTACSSSALAVHLACQSLRLGECDIAIAGGTEAEMPAHHGYQWDPGGPMSADGHCRPFDASAGGTVFSTGAGALVLKRLSDARADGDHVWAVIRGSAVNNDGRRKAGFSAPSISGQAAVVREAMALAEVDATQVSYVEAHATGTPLGDPIEVAALAKAYGAIGSERRGEPLLLSSVKGNIGHLGHASGVASLIKLALCFEYEHRAPTANFTAPNPRLLLEETPFSVCDELVEWKRTPRTPRIAGLNSLGIGGTNVHLVLEEGPATERTAFDGRPRVLLWSGRDVAAADSFRPELAAHLERTGDEAFADTAGVLQEGRTHHPVRAALVAGNAEEARETLRMGSVLSGDASESRSVVFLFPGQSAQHPRMGVGLYGADAVFSEAMDGCFEEFATHGLSLRDSWLNADAARLSDTALAQPLLFSVEYALAMTWIHRGVRPDAVLGHSLGELTAATVAGVFDLPDAARLIAERAAASDAALPGGMLAVRARPRDLTDLPDGVVLAVVNGEAESVLAGPPEALDAAQQVLRVQGVSCRLLATSRAFHSPLMASASDRFAAVVRTVRLRQPAVPVFSAAAGGLLGDQVSDPEFWTRQLVRPVRFDRALDAVLAGERRTLLEVGPGHTLTRLARLHPATRSGDSGVTATLPPGEDGDDERSALTTAATLWTLGHPLDWAALRGSRPLRRLAVPGYQYRNKRHWLELGATAAVPDDVPERAEAITGASPEPQPFSVLTWTGQPRATGPRRADGTTALALVPDSADALPALVALHQAGHRVVVVRPGDGFAEKAGEFRVRPDHPGDLRAVFDALSGRGRSPQLVVHGLGLRTSDRPDRANAAGLLADTFHSLAELARATARSDAELLVLATRSVDVTGAEEVDPVKATLHGAVRTLGLEAPELNPRLIDVEPLTAEEDLATEITSDEGEPVVALRGPGRWVRVERPHRPVAPAVPVVRRDGVYLLTGGSGGLGLVVARALAGTGMRPHLVLVSRAGTADRTAVAQLESMGARVRVEACDVTDHRGMRRVFDVVRAHHGALHGVVHLAGVPGDGMLLLRSRADADAVLAPKVMGTLVLAELLAEMPPVDFFVSFSSRAAVDGLVGSADYAAANSFLDAHARLLTRAGIPAVSVNWPAWRTAGMAAEPVERTRWETVLDVDGHPVLDEHRIDSVPVLPGTGHLDLVVRAFRETHAGPGAPVRLSDVVFQRVLTGDVPRTVRIAFRPDGDGLRFTIASTPRDLAGAEVEHATGFVSAHVPTRPTGEPLAALRDRISGPVPQEDRGQRLFTLGPRWDNVRRISVNPAQDAERLVDLALPEPFHADTARHPLHPALLDSATSNARVPDRDAPHLPFGYAGLDLHEDLPAELVSHIRRRPAAAGLIVADVDLYAPDGRLLARISGYTMRAVKDDGFVTAPQEAAPVEGIELERGGELFLSLLGGRHPYHVAVRPHLDGVPVALAPAALVVAPQPASPRAAPALVPVTQAPAQPAVPGLAEEPATDVAERLTWLWSRLLGITEIQPDDDFFALGGNSLTAVELMTGIRDEFGVRMSIVAMFDHPTLTELAKALTAEGVR
ncbi:MULTISPECIES: type I polyketide synthase [Actinosynnema]|uniref:type I polyketide synthase n=1 Tax=Actinosynnema TaxID=40566 RepID=UPI0020A2AFC3|nr:type I polyketide synthase [Actinosynnema pretiosum]